MNLGFGEMLVLGILALVVFGPEKLPEAARNAGQMIARLRREANSTLDEFRRSADLAELRALRNEVREATADLRLRSPLRWPTYGTGFGTRFGSEIPGIPEEILERRSTALAPSTLRPRGVPPFDSDAT